MDEGLLCSCSLQSSGTSELSGKGRIRQRCTCGSDVCEKLLPLKQSCSLCNGNYVKCKPWRRKPLALCTLQRIYFRTTLWLKLLLINWFEGFTRVCSETTMVKMHLSNIFHWYLVVTLLGGLSLPLTSGQDSLFVRHFDGNQLPNQVVYQGKVFSYTIPERAFDCALDTFVVSETADRFLSNWLAYDDVKRVLYGVPSEKDIGTYNILVVALAKGERVRGHICGSKSFSVTVMPVDEHLPISVYLGSGSHDESKQEFVQSLPCTPGVQVVIGTVILSTDLENLNGHERTAILVQMANHLNTVTNNMSLFSGAVSHPMIQQLDSPALVATGPGDGRFAKGARSLLTWNVGCGAVRLEDATLARLESDAQDGTMSGLLGFPVVGWHVSSGTQKSVVRRRFRRQVGGTPTPTPTMSIALPTQISSISTSAIMSRSIISTKSLYASDSTRKLSTSTVDLTSEMPKRTTVRSSSNSLVHSPSALTSTPLLSLSVPATISTLTMSNVVLSLNRTTDLLRSSTDKTLLNRTSLIDVQSATSTATLLLNATTGLVMSSRGEGLVQNRTSLISQSALAASTVTLSLNVTTELVMTSTMEASVNRTFLISPSVLTSSTVKLSLNVTTGFVMSPTEASSANRTSLTGPSALASIVTLSLNKTTGIITSSTETKANRTSVISPSLLSISPESLSLSTTSGFVVSSGEATSVNRTSMISKSSFAPTPQNKTVTISSSLTGFNSITIPSSLIETTALPINSSTVFVVTPRRTLEILLSPMEFSSVNRTTLFTSSLLTMVVPNMTSAMMSATVNSLLIPNMTSAMMSATVNSLLIPNMTSAMMSATVNSLLIPETTSLLSNRTAQVFSSSVVSSVSYRTSTLVTTVSSMASPGITRLSPVATSPHGTVAVTNLSTPQTIATILTSRSVHTVSHSSTVLGTVLSSFPHHSSSTMGLLLNMSTITSSPLVSTTQLQSSLVHSSILQSSIPTTQNLTASTVLATLVSTMQQSVTMSRSTILQSASESSQVVTTSGLLSQSYVTVSNAGVSRITGTLQASMFSSSTINILSSVISSPLVMSRNMSSFVISLNIRVTTAESSVLANSTVVIDKSSLFTIATPAFSPTVTRGARSLSSSPATNQTLVLVTSGEAKSQSSVIASSTPRLQTTVFTLSSDFPVTPHMTNTFVFTRAFRTSTITNSTKVVLTTTGSLSLVRNSSFHVILNSTALPKTTRSISFFLSSFFTSSVVPVLNSSVVSRQTSLLRGSDFASSTLMVSNSSKVMTSSRISTVPASDSFTNKTALTTTTILRNTTVVVTSSVSLPSANIIVTSSSSLTISSTNRSSRNTFTFSSADVNSSRVVFIDSSTVFETNSSSISTEIARNSTVMVSMLKPDGRSSVSNEPLRNTTRPFSASQVISNFSSVLVLRTSSVLANLTLSVKRTTDMSSSAGRLPSSPFGNLTSAGPSPSSSVPPMMTRSTVELYSSRSTHIDAHITSFTRSTQFTLSNGLSVSPSPTVNGSASSLSSVDVSVSVTPSDTAKVTPGTTALSANSFVRSTNATSSMAPRKTLVSTFSFQRQSTADILNRTLSIRSTVTLRNSTSFVRSSGTAMITASVPASEVTQIISTAYTTRSVTPGSNTTSIFSSSRTVVFESSVTQTSLTSSSTHSFASSRNMTIFTSSVTPNVTQTNPKVSLLVSVTGVTLSSVPASEVTQVTSTAYTIRSVTAGSNTTWIFSSNGTAVFESSVTQTSLTSSSTRSFASSRNMTIFTSSVTPNVTQTNPKVSPLVSVTNESPYISFLPSSTSPSSGARINVTSTVLPTVTLSVSSNLTLGVNLTTALTSHAPNNIYSSVITRTRLVNISKSSLATSLVVSSPAVSGIERTSALASASSTAHNLTPSFHTGLVSRSFHTPTVTLKTSKEGSRSLSGIKTRTPSSTPSVSLKTSATMSTPVSLVTTTTLTRSSPTIRRIFTGSFTALITTTKATSGKPSLFSSLSRLVKTATTTLLSATRSFSILKSTPSAFGLSTLPSGSAFASSSISQTVTVTNITQNIAPTSAVSPAVPNSPPKVYNNIGRLTAAAGKAWYYRIPSDTFYDVEDHADTRNLTLSLSFVDGRIIPADFWLQFDNQTHIIYGLPMSTHVPNGNNGEELVLRARDSQGAETHDAFEVLVAIPETPLVQQLTVKFSNDFLSFNSNVSQRLLLLRKIADYYGDPDESFIRVSAFTSGSVIMAWSNDSLPTERCDEEKVKYVESKIFLPSGEIREEFDVALDGFPVESGSHRRLGVCNESNVVPPGTIAPLQRSSSEDDLWHKLVLVGVLVALLLIIIAIFLAWYFRRKRPKPYDQEKRTYKKRKPILLEPEIELKPISGKPIVLPDDDPSIPPSYLSETLLDKPPENFSDNDEEDYGKRSPSVYNEPPRPTHLEPNDSPPPPYFLPPIYGSYC